MTLSPRRHENAAIGVALNSVGEGCEFLYVTNAESRTGPNYYNQDQNTLYGSVMGWGQPRVVDGQTKLRAPRLVPEALFTRQNPEYPAIPGAAAMVADVAAILKTTIPIVQPAEEFVLPGLGLCNGCGSCQENEGQYQASQRPAQRGIHVMPPGVVKCG